MNAERLRAVAKAIQGQQVGRRKRFPRFNMKDWAMKLGWKFVSPKEVTCGTTCCIAGMTNFLYKKEVDPYIGSHAENARRILGLSEYDASRLFYGRFSNSEIGKITAEETSAELERLAQKADREAA